MPICKRLLGVVGGLALAQIATAAGLEVMHMTPAPQPALSTISADDLHAFRDAFNASDDRPRVLVMLSPNCPLCLRGASSLEQTLQRDSTRLRVLVVWEHVTPSDRRMGIPTTPVLAKIPDRRAIQFWDAGRVLSYHMRHDLPPEMLASVAEMDSTDVPIVWDCVALFRAGARWDTRFPTPEWGGRPVAEVIATFRQRLAALEESTAVNARR